MPLGPKASEPVVVLYVLGDCEKWFELVYVPG
jgi:hypothetical protein